MSTPINLYNAGLFSAIAYAPDGNVNAMTWALDQTGTFAHQDAERLKLEGWSDITAAALSYVGVGDPLIPAEVVSVQSQLGEANEVPTLLGRDTQSLVVEFHDVDLLRETSSLPKPQAP